MPLRPYQQKLKDEIYAAWAAGAANVLAVAPTGAGKTRLFSDIAREHQGAGCAIAHRKELVSQMSGAFNAERLPHKIIAPQATIKDIVREHMETFGYSMYNPDAPMAVAGVDTLINRVSQYQDWARSVTLWVQDESHHVLRGNKWGDAADMFPNAKGLGVTATPLRADGSGLGRHADGLFDSMVVGPTMRQLINDGWLTEYRLFAPPSDLDLSAVPVSSTTGDYVKGKLKTAVRASHVVGDVVIHYLRIAPGKLGITFAPDVETATEIAAQFNAGGVPAAVVSAKTPASERRQVMRKFRDRELLQLVNVDLFGEGYDLPALEVVSMARPTQSYALFVQQFGRALRLLEGKDRAIIIDHVGNIVRHGLPDIPKQWTLDRRERRGKAKPNDAIPIRACPKCTEVYERVYAACPHCGHIPKPAARSGPEFVDGDLAELDAETLRQMRGEIALVDRHVTEYQAELAARRVPRIGQMANAKRHLKRQEAQAALRESISWWAGFQRAAGRDDSESYRRFYFKFGLDVLSAQALKTEEALTLAGRVNEHLGQLATGE